MDNDVKYSEKVINAFVVNGKRKDIMQAAGIGRSKYYELKKDDAFMRIVRQRRTEVVGAAVQMMEQNMLENVERLQNVIREPPERAQIVLNGLQLYFNVYGNLKESTEFMERLDALEGIGRACNDVFSTF